MKFINRGGPIKIRIGKSPECYWKTVKKNEVVDISEEYGRRLNLIELKITEGKLGDQKVETKQVEYTNDSDFYNELLKIKGIGKNTAQDIINIYPVKKQLIETIKAGEKLSFRNDVELKLRKKYGK